jgi:hypothetical protein
LTASEFAFLAFGLVLGVASGAALIEVLRARPPASREIRVTVAPNAIQGRLAATLADPARATEPVGPARGGPGDRRLTDEQAPAAEPDGPARRQEDRQRLEPAAAVAALPSPNRTPVPDAGSVTTSGRTATGPGPTATGALAENAAPANAAPASAAPAARPDPLWLRPAAGAAPGPGLVAVPMSIEPDPVTTALRATAAVLAQPIAARGTSSAAERAPAAGTATTVAGTPTAAAGTPTAARTRATAAPGPATTEPTRASGSPGGTGAQAAEPAAGPTTSPPADGPCADERRVADERCAVAARAREGATGAAETLRRAQRSYDDLVQRAEAAAATADPRAVRAAKEQAQARFRGARAGAGTRDDVEAGARAWLAEINRINHDTREAALAAERDRSAAAQLGPSLERLVVEADAARITAERAEEACVAAREAVAACDEASRLAVAASSAAPAAPDEAPARIAAATPEPEDEFEFSTPMRSSAGADAPILRILRGDREALQRAVAQLAGDDADARRRWQAQLGALADALIARSIEAAAFDFPTDHFFWGPFSQSQNRDIAAGLSSLGFRFDGYGDWVDERVPSQRDLSLAVGYAGLDPMRIRHWPSEAEMRELLRDVRVAADEYVAGAAGGMTLGELVTLLGPRADPLAELWNAWGTVRPILLEAS